MAMRTPLYDWHVAHGARMVEFGGWDMPVQYASIVEEHRAVRSSVGLFDISHMARLSFAGPGSLDLIQYVYTNNAATMKDGQVRYGLICNEQGGVLDDVLVYRWPYGYAMAVNASNRAKIVDWLTRQVGRIANLSSKVAERFVVINDQTLATCMVGVQGPQALSICRDLTETDPSQLGYYFAAPTRYHGQPCVVSRTGYTGEDGIELMIGAAPAVELWRELIGRGARPCGLGARDTLRLEAGMPLYGHELTEEIDPIQAGLGWAVKMDKGDFIGRAALCRRSHDSSCAAGLAWSWKANGLPARMLPCCTTAARLARSPAGTFAPTLDKSVAMAYVDSIYTETGTHCAVDVRGNSVKARIVALPFYRRPKTPVGGVNGPETATLRPDA